MYLKVNAISCTILQKKYNIHYNNVFSNVKVHCTFFQECKHHIKEKNLMFNMFVMFTTLFRNAVTSSCSRHCISGDVFVVYVRDKALDDGSLYHPRLTSIKRHHTLTSLSDTNRVLSLNTTFSEYQRDFLVKELQNAFNCSKTGIV